MTWRAIWERLRLALHVYRLCGYNTIDRLVWAAYYAWAPAVSGRARA